MAYAWTACIAGSRISASPSKGHSSGLAPMTPAPMDNKDALFSIFKRFDTDGDGLISEAEFRGILEALGSHSSDEVLALEFAAIDANGDQMVDFDEFMAWWLNDE